MAAGGRVPHRTDLPATPRSVHDGAEPIHRRRPSMRDHTDPFRFAERRVRGRDEQGTEEVVTIWVDRCDGALWRVGRATDLHLRDNPEPRTTDTVFEGFEMSDALEAANNALEEDVVACEESADRNTGVRPFTETELRERLERWYFDRERIHKGA
jgi:hypothetical protein